MNCCGQYKLIIQGFVCTYWRDESWSCLFLLHFLPGEFLEEGMFSHAVSCLKSLVVIWVKQLQAETIIK